MVIYAFAFLNQPQRPLNLPSGIHNALTLVNAGDIAAVVEPDISIEDLHANDERLMQAVIIHDRVVRTVFDQVPVLPLRFGTCFVDGDRLQEHLALRSQSYLETLERLKGKAEYTLKAIPIEYESLVEPIQAKGRDYLLEKKRRYQAQTEYQLKQQEDFRDLLQQVGDRYTMMQADSSDGEVEKINMLCDRHLEDQLLLDYQDWQQRFSSWALNLSEALPPYHFIS